MRKTIKKMIKYQEENNKNIKTIKELEEQKTKELEEIKKGMERNWNRILQMLDDKERL